MLRHGERAFAFPKARPGAGAARVEAALAALDPARSASASWYAASTSGRSCCPSWPTLAVRHARWAEGRVRAQPGAALRRHRVRALLVPFDGAPVARAVLRAAQAEGIPTAVLNDGWKGDDHQPEGMAADHAFALSDSVREQLLRPPPRPGGVVVTGDPRNDRRPAAAPARAAATCSSARSPSRRRISTAAAATASASSTRCCGGIAASALAGRRVTVKLHPADRTEAYARDRRPPPGARRRAGQQRRRRRRCIPGVGRLHHDLLDLAAARGAGRRAVRLLPRQRPAPAPAVQRRPGAGAPDGRGRRPSWRAAGRGRRRRAGPIPQLGRALHRPARRPEHAPGDRGVVARRLRGRRGSLDAMRALPVLLITAGALIAAPAADARDVRIAWPKKVIRAGEFVNIGIASDRRAEGVAGAAQRVRQAAAARRRPGP